MIRLNDNFRLLPESYLFSTVGKRLAEYKERFPQREVIRMDIGDVTLPLPEAAVTAMHHAIDDLTDPSTFVGYGPEQGHLFLRESIACHDYERRGLPISADEIFISDGAKSDLGNLGDILGEGIRVAIADPAYPAYLDSNVIDGRGGTPGEGRWSDVIYLDSNVIDGRGGTPGEGRWSDVIYLECPPERHFLPLLPAERPDVIILCYPNNPTGASITLPELQKWIDYARKEGCLIIYDSAYEAYVTSPEAVRSVYEAEHADEVAIEVRSFSKTAGFTGVRCGYTVVPKKLKGIFADGSEANINRLWNRRQCTKFNGASYIVQRGAAALYSPEGREQTMRNIDIYLNNAHLIRTTLSNAGFEVTGGIDSPYVWARHPSFSNSWELFDHLLAEAAVSCTPGSGFGACGEGYIRLTGFNTPENTRIAMERIRHMFS